MEDQGQKNHLSGVETQHHNQVHHCRKCGWPFPKPHPSAKHRRAHKRVCGTLEGYKLQDSSHTIVSDDDHSDDGDFKTPQISFKKRLERSPSEDDVYSDAVSNFADASLNSGVASESASAVEKVSKAVVPEFGASAEGTPSGNLTSSVTVQAPMIAPTIADQSGNRPDSGDLSSTIVAETQLDFPEGASNVHESDAECFAKLPTGIKSPVENDSEIDFSLNDKVKVTEEINDAAEPMLQATDEVSEIADPNEGKLVSKTPQKDISPEHFAEGADEGVHLFHVPHDVPAAEKFIQGFRDHPKKEDVQPDNFDLEVEHSPSVGEYNTIKEEELRKVNVLQDVLVQEKIIQGFKDYEKMGWVGHGNRDFPNAVEEEKGEVSCVASDVLLEEKDGLISNQIDKEEAVTDAVHKSRQFDSNIPVKSAEEEVTSEEEDDRRRRSRNVACLVPDSVPVIEATTHSAGECILNGEEVSVVKEVEVSGVIKNLSDTASILSLDSGAPRTTILDGKDDGREEKMEDKIPPTFLSSEAPSAVEDGYVDESCVEDGTKAEEEEERFVVAEIGIVHVAEDDSVRSNLDDSAVVESPRKSAGNETLTEKEQLKKGGDEVKGSSSSMNELGHDFDKEAALLPVVVSQVPNSPNTVVEAGGYEASLQVEDGTKQQLTASVLDSSSSSPSESLDANWGSVSVLSTQSDTITPSDEPRKVGKPNTKQQQATAVGDKLETSFTTTTSSSQDGAASPGRKKKNEEEMIAKVTNWTTAQQQSSSSSSSPLKKKSLLLVEANREAKPPISHILKENNDDNKKIAPTTTKVVEEEKKSSSVKEEDNGAATVASILTSSTEAKAAALSEEWNSPARYPSDEIKRDKKVKGRPYWAQFVCCSSGIN